MIKVTFYFPTISEYATLLENTGFNVRYAVLFDRPPELKGENGLKDWINMFVKTPFSVIDDDSEVITMKRNNYFVEGLQGAGKTTLVQRLSENLMDYKVFHEGDFSPIELAWCAYVTEEQYNNILTDYPSLKEEIKRKTVSEDEHRIICYTQVLTDIPNFHKSLEKFEIYNGNLTKESFENVILGRYKKWNEEGQIFECSIFQNIIENQMLYLMLTDDEILDFYKKLENILADKPYKIIYLDVDDIPKEIDIIRKERSDDRGNELWFPLMVRYVEESPYGREHALIGSDGLLKHLERRRALEHRLIDEIFKEKTIVVKAKNYELNEIVAQLLHDK